MKPLINEIKERYKFTLNPSETLDNIHLINASLYVEFKSAIKKYNFKKKINKIKEVLEDEKEEINQELKKSLSLKIEEIEMSIDNTLKKIEKEHHDRFILFLDFTYDYNDFKNRTEARNTYHKIIEGILNQAAENFIKYEKIFVLINDNILDIKNKLNINF